MKKKSELEQELTDLRADLAKLEAKHKEIETILGKDAVAELIELKEELCPDFGQSLLDRARDVLSDAAEVEDLREEVENTDKHYIALDAALTAALADREQMLKRLGLTDFEWSMQGGNSYADVEA